METFENLPTENPWIEIRQSKYGRGLFAKQDIPIGTKVCYYDVKEVNKDEPELSDKILVHFTDESKLWIGIENPVNNWGVGQIANDCIIPHVMEFPDIHKYEKERVKKIVDSYSIISNLNSSLDFLNKPSRWMYTLRYIKKDEELTYSYGNQYWYRYLIENASKPLWRLIYYSLARKKNLSSTLTDNDYQFIYTLLGFTDNNQKPSFTIPDKFNNNNKDRVDYLWEFFQLS